MDKERWSRTKRRALIKRATIIDRIKFVYDLGVAGETDVNARTSFLISVNDLTELWTNFSVENDAILDALVELGEDDSFSSFEELEVTKMLVSARAFASRFSSLTVNDEKFVPNHKSPTDVVFRSETTAKSVEVQPPTSSHSIRLPEIPLPRFEGNLAGWPDFRDRFTALVHSRSTISNVEKFYYLLSCLGTDALEAVKGITVSNDTYTLAWMALVERYDKPRKLASTLLESMLTAPVIQNESVTSLNRFLSNFDENISILNSVGIPNLGDFILFSLAFRSLPTLSRRLFETTNQEVYPRAQDLFKFVKSRVQVLELAGEGFSSGLVKNPSFKTFKPEKEHFQRQKPKPSMSLIVTKATESTSAVIKKCLSCGGSHSLKNCSIFKELPVSERYDMVSKNKLCMVCFSSKHWANRCQESCSICKRRHHALLHRERKSSQDDTTPQSSAVLLGSRSTPTVLLGTALVLVRDASGEFQPVRALLDSGSQISAISRKASDQLGLRRSRWTASVTGLSGHQVPEVAGTVQFCVQPRHEAAQLMSVRAWVLPIITSEMPSQQLAIGIRESCSHLQLADPYFDTPGPVELLLGADVFPQVWIGERKSIGRDLPFAYSTVFGWMLLGPVQQLANPVQVHCILATMSPSIESLMEDFWKMEEPEEAPLQFTDEGCCEAKFRAETKIDTNGRYNVPLPFRPDQSSEFKGMLRIAGRRFELLERKLERDAVLGDAYRKFMSEYESLGHMTIAQEPARYVIPHHAVWKRNGDLSKLRVVFDASARCESGQSLNDALYVGPKLQRDIVDVLLGFRLYRYAFSSDICKMYRQIQVNSEYRKFQHILWRASPKDTLKEYALNTVTYGVNSAPFLALRVLHDVADRSCTKSPAVRNVLRLQTYMDDICTGADTLKDALELQRNLIKILGKHGFELKKWSSNTRELLADIPSEDRTSGSMTFDGEKVAIQVLGLQWNPGEDSLGYDFSSIQFVFTKRGVLSVIARIFDPLGLLAPVLLLAKHLMQSIWLSKIAWDDKLPSEIAESWSLFISELPSLSSVRVPRFVETQSGSTYLLCGFCDASVRGYAALVYLRVVHPSGQVSVHLLGAKTKLAPIHTTTIPRLELCAAGLLTRWLVRIQTTLSAQLNISGLYAWTDSSITLSWLTTPHVTFKVFVSNRVNQICQALPDCNWRHIASRDNPADCASRGMLPSELSGHSLYWNGPSFLLDSPNNWSLDISRVPVEQLPEVKLVSLLVSSDQVNEWFEIFSSYERMLRVLAWMTRFILKCRKSFVFDGTLTRMELNESLNIIVQCSQRCHFKELLSELSRSSPVSSKKLARLSPYLDVGGVIRVGGRLRNAQMSEQQKRPILLSKSSYLSKLIIRHWHIYSCHSGTRLLMSVLSRQFWILSARRIIGNVIKNCSICVRMAAVNVQPVMADLPQCRVSQCRPFARVGIDFAGPFLIRETKLRKARIYKIYISVFVCMVVKAVHLEVVSDLSTPAFLAALDRFVARRGLPVDIYSDCGTNFVGASKQLRHFMLDTNRQDQLASHLSCSWHFNPPSAPHFGGLWEAAVKSMKTLLIRTVGNHTLSFEELNTVVCRIESVLNSRPLTPLSSEPDDLECLTPGHFLTGQPLLTVPETKILDTPCNLLTRWKLLHQCHQAFWKRWSAEYLNCLQVKSKWTSSNGQIKVGDLVVIKDNLTPPLMWRLGRVLELFPGEDNVVRVVKILTKQGTLVRPVVKLVRLPVE